MSKILLRKTLLSNLRVGIDEKILEDFGIQLILGLTHEQERGSDE